MKAEIIAVGTELLLGDILNSDAQYLSKQLSSLGIEMYHQSVVGDNAKRLEEVLAEAFSRSDLVITSGGLGPTEDDLTKETGCKYFGKKLVEDKKALEMLKDYFARINRKMTENNFKQALVPEGSIVLYNNNGTAPGIIIDDNGKILVMLPGPPRELNPMFEQYVKPYLAAKQEYIFVSRVLRVSKIGESTTEYLLRDLIDNQTNPTIATYVKNIEVIVRLTAKAKNEEEANKLIDPVAEEIYKRLGNNLYAEGDTTISEVVCKKLLEKNITVAVSESCTGGLLSKTFTDIAGISQIFMEGAVTYSNDAKMRRLGVKRETLDKYGAVSAETAAEMAEGIAKSAGTDIGISTTGIAGPGGGTPEKPVGLVYIGLSIFGNVITKEVHFNGNRDVVRVRTVDAVFDSLRRELEKIEQNG
ncbi:MAG: competence/damage-inducible protein A [Ruminococcus sp.]|nr:competence/damage-inducible protein A [Ruminococcus sp.]MCI5598394.1 competence/damage-inducible protein A [Ruminococcus sp.]